MGRERGGGREGGKEGKEKRKERKVAWSVSSMNLTKRKLGIMMAMLKFLFGDPNTP